MITSGYVLVMLGVFFVREGLHGRNFGDALSDLKTLVTALFTFDTSAIGTALSTSAAASTPTAATAFTAAPSSAASGAGGTALLTEMHKLAASATGYRLGGTGPAYYDCSGLVWRAMTNLGIYTGSRFVVSSFASALGSKVTVTNAPQVGDVVTWVNGSRAHMGVVDGQGTFFSALNPRQGIVTIPITSLTGEGSPKFYRIVGGQAANKTMTV